MSFRILSTNHTSFTVSSALFTLSGLRGLRDPLPAATISSVVLSVIASRGSAPFATRTRMTLRSDAAAANINGVAPLRYIGG